MVDLKERTTDGTESFSIGGWLMLLQTAQNYLQEGGMFPNLQLERAPLLRRLLCLRLIL